MLSFLRRPRVLVPVGLVAAALVTLGVAAARSGTPGCTVPAPEVTVPAQLRTIGGFDQPWDGNDRAALQDAAVRAASALHSDLDGASAGAPVAEAAGGSDPHDALVVPLSEAGGGSQAPPRVVGLVAFLRDCSGRAWYDDVDDLLRTDPSLLPQHYPTTTQPQAAARLGVAPAGLRLVWRGTPFHPLWLDPASGRTVVAGPPT